MPGDGTPRRGVGRGVPERADRTGPRAGQEPVDAVVAEHHREDAVVGRPVDVRVVRRRQQRDDHRPAEARDDRRADEHRDVPDGAAPARPGTGGGEDRAEHQRGQHHPRLQHLRLEADADGQSRREQRPPRPGERGPLPPDQGDGQGCREQTVLHRVPEHRHEDRGPGGQGGRDQAGTGAEPPEHDDRDREGGDGPSTTCGSASEAVDMPNRWMLIAWGTAKPASLSSVTVAPGRTSRTGTRAGTPTSTAQRPRRRTGRRRARGSSSRAPRRAPRSRRAWHAPRGSAATSGRGRSSSCGERPAGVDGGAVHGEARYRGFVQVRYRVLVRVAVAGRSALGAGQPAEHPLCSAAQQILDRR